MGKAAEPSKYELLETVRNPHGFDAEGKQGGAWADSESRASDARFQSLLFQDPLQLRSGVFTPKRSEFEINFQFNNSCGRFAKYPASHLRVIIHHLIGGKGN